MVFFSQIKVHCDSSTSHSHRKKHTAQFPPWSPCTHTTFNKQTNKQPNKTRIVLLACLCVFFLCAITNMPTQPPPPPPQPTPSPSSYSKVIEQLLQCDPKRPAIIPPSTLKGLASAAQQIMRDQPVFLPLRAPITICGDIHGQFDDLRRVFSIRGTPPNVPYLFLGDYVDRGEHSVEVIALLLALKVEYPNHIFLLRGNHECPDTNGEYGFRDQCATYLTKCPIGQCAGLTGDSMWRMFNETFQWMPLCASVNGRIFCVHGGLSPELKDLTQLDSIRREELASVPSKGLVCDLLWSDPDRNEPNWGENERGCSYTFGPKIVNDFCDKHGFHLVCRAHQVMDSGYEFFCKRKLATVFTASNYCGDYGNRGSVLHVDPKLRCSLVILLPNNKQKETLLHTSDDDATAATAAGNNNNNSNNNDEGGYDSDSELSELFGGGDHHHEQGTGGRGENFEMNMDRAASPEPTLRAPSPRPQA
jgi:serine/threonine-protein phosphatase PP1 catalytic subunit